VNAGEKKEDSEEEKEEALEIEGVPFSKGGEKREG
jgi:hypothetical protein